MIKDKLEFLAKAQDFNIKKSEFEWEDGVYEVSLKERDTDAHPVIATISSLDDNEVMYFVGNVYNNCSEYAQIDINELNRLVEMVEYLVGSKE